MKAIETIRTLGARYPKTKKVIGGICIIIGFISWITPFTPFGLILFVGLQMVGIRLVFIDKIRSFLKRKQETTNI